MNAQNAASNGKMPTVISTFAGCGGSSLGYKMAGFRELLAVEWDDNAVETFSMNFPGIPIYHGDIAKLTGNECLNLAGIGVRELDVLDGSPPCQGFSTAGKRRFSDPRNSLFNEFAKLLNELQPKVFVMENVNGLIEGCMKQAYLAIVNTLRECGYRINAEVMNAMYYNVPQSRQRIIVIGVRNNLGIEPSHPRPQTKPIVFRDAVSGLAEDGEQRILPPILIEYGRRHGRGWSTKPNLYRQIKGNMAGSFSLKWCEWDDVCGTIPKSEISLTGIVHPNKKRYLSESELKRVGSFPDSFKFTSRAKAVERIGNSVPPNLMRAIAEHIKNNILEKINSRSDQTTTPRQSMGCA